MATVTPTLIVAIFAAVLGMFQFGFNTGVINLPQEKIEKFIAAAVDEEFDQSKVKLLFSVAVNVCSIGGMIGGLSAGFVADKFGRRQGLWYTQALSILGSILMGCCKEAGSYVMLVFGRLFIGLACGLFTGLVPLYVSEIAPVEIRGGLGTLNQLAVTIGILLSQVFGLEEILGSEESWPLLLALGGAIPSVIQLVLLPLMPESPRYLIINQDNRNAGHKALSRLRLAGEVDAEFEEINAEKAGTDDPNDDSMSVFQLLKSKANRLPLAICVLMHLSQQLSGMVAIFYYSTNFFIGAGVDVGKAQYYSLGVGAIMVIMTIITIPLMDFAGRRSLHLSGLAGIVFSSIMIVIGLNLGDGDWTGYFIIFFTLLFVVFFALGPGSIPWLITGGRFTQGPRPAAIAIATLVNWISNLAVGLIFPVLESGAGNFSFLPFAIIVAILFVVLYVYLPETKGKSVEEVTDMLQEQGASRGSYTQSDRLVKC